MIRSLSARDPVLSEFCRGSVKGVVREPSTPSKKKYSYLWISLHSRRLLLLPSRFQRWGDSYLRKDVYGRGNLRVSMQAVMEQIGLGQMKKVKLTILVLGLLNLAIVVVAVLVALRTSRVSCPRNVTLGAVIMALGGGVRLIWMLGMGFAQAGFASTMIVEGVDTSTARPAGPSNQSARRQRRKWYQRWLWWSRIGTIMTVLQVFGTSYFTWFLARNVTITKRHITFCQGDEEQHVEQRWLVSLMLALPTVGGIIVVAQCCLGSDVLAWRLLYGAQYEAWRSHYRQMFDYGIREVLCCLGRRRYMNVMDEDAVDTIAGLLGDLVAYRSEGASHLEVIAGVALLRKGNAKLPPGQEFQPAPDVLIAEAAVLHPYAEAAYTGPLLDIGRNPLTFPCAWLYRQGVLSPWTRNRRPALEGDNWWRGHAAAFLNHAHLSPEALRQGRVLQTNRESVYFVVVLQQLRFVLVAIRGTETPEDLLTDGLGRECALTKSDLRGILENSTISDRVKQEVLATMPHFGHVGVMEAARELAMELDNLADDEEIIEHAADSYTRSNKGNASMLRNHRESLLSNKTGLLSSLLGPGGECDGFSLRLVGHSLGGSIATLTGLRLASRFPNLHVYAFGVLPCVDLVTAEACSTFTTSIIYNDEFASRLSLAAILRLRASALQALASDSNSDAALVAKLTRRLFKPTSQSDLETGNRNQGSKQKSHRYSNAVKGGAFLLSHACRCIVLMPKHRSSQQATSIQLASFKQNKSQDFEQESLKDRRNEVCKVAAAEASRSSLDTPEDGGGAVNEQLSKDKAVHGVSLADREAVCIDAGEILDEEEARALIINSETDRQGQAGDRNEDTEVSFELLDNGMPKHHDLLFPGSNLQELWPAEMFVPGLIIHVIRTEGDSKWFTLPKTLTFSRRLKVVDEPQHKAVLKNRNLFRDIIVSPTMFLDHMPWKCQYALNDVLGQLSAAKQRQGSSSAESNCPEGSSCLDLT